MQTNDAGRRLEVEEVISGMTIFVATVAIVLALFVVLLVAWKNRRGA